MLTGRWDTKRWLNQQAMLSIHSLPLTDMGSMQCDITSLTMVELLTILITETSSSWRDTRRVSKEDLVTWSAESLGPKYGTFRTQSKLPEMESWKRLIQAW